MKEHAKATPIGYIHDGQPLFWKARAPLETAVPNDNRIWIMNPNTGHFFPINKTK